MFCCCCLCPNTSPASQSCSTVSTLFLLQHTTHNTAELPQHFPNIFRLSCVQPSWDRGVSEVSKLEPGLSLELLSCSTCQTLYCGGPWGAMPTCSHFKLKSDLTSTTHTHYYRSLMNHVYEFQKSRRVSFVGWEPGCLPVAIAPVPRVGSVAAVGLRPPSPGPRIRVVARVWRPLHSGARVGRPGGSVAG